MQYLQPSHLYTQLIDTLPTSLSWSSQSTVKGDPKKSVKWIDGLRGIASFLVVLTHLSRGWDYELFSPRDSEDVSARLLQWPILRIPWQGRLGVTIFAFLTGYVCALKPLKLSRAGDTGAAFETIAKSAFRRPPRLIFPATIALLISWIVAQFGGFIVANRSDCQWCRYAAPDLEDSFWKELIRLPMNFLSTWTTGYMAYDDHQWALLPLLLSSMLVYLVLSATMFVKFKYRVVIYIGMLLYFHQDASKDAGECFWWKKTYDLSSTRDKNANADSIETFQMQAIFGMLLSDFSYHKPLKDWIENNPQSRKMLTIPLTVVALFLASYPGEHPEWAGWSNVMLNASHYIFPPGVNVGKRYTALAVDMIILAIYFSPSAKDFLSSRLLLWLGKQSFAVYLIHGTMLRVVLCWMLYGISGQPWVGPEAATDDQRDWLPIRPPWVVAISIPVWIGLVYLVAALWTAYVDTFCASMTQKLEKAVFAEDEKLPLPAVSIPMQTT
ncbi:Acyltransferase 3 [Penicillium griseofulvum]|uniref:Acyltransferase 3 n=1 Tax=Penicillium patulum TaxID=5078 RepID=A0A135LLM5_PENPA|nr:Acyltransferase 3 [Penicillium griseofulvum]KXG49858.1 Acyltransferase 3 [Penicillium griseofulvum]